jgi:hypothetical protein
MRLRNGKTYGTDPSDEDDKENRRPSLPMQEMKAVLPGYESSDEDDKNIRLIAPLQERAEHLLILRLSKKHDMTIR